MYYRSISKRAISVCIIILLAFTLGIAPSGWLLSPVIAVSGPDLTVSDIALSPLTPAIDDTVIITVTIKNQGTATAAASNVVCYIDNTILATNSIESLGAGAMVTTPFTWQAQPGSHIIRSIADSGGFVPETDESNNTMTYSLTTLAPDLVVQSILWSPTNPSKGDSITFNITVRNQGNSRSRATRLNLYIDGNSRGYQDIDAIDPGNTTTKTYHWTAQAGQHTIKAVVDENNQVKENNETNNERTVTFTTLPPDLTVKTLTWSPAEPSKNDIVTFTANVTNQGTGRSDPCQLAYYIDGSYQSMLIVNSLEAGFSENITFTWTATLDLHEIKAVVDFNNTVVESDEDNNQYKASFLTMLPDLAVTAITWLPADAGVGDVVTFTANITNLGDGGAEPSHAGCYISGSYASYINTPAIEPGENVTIEFQWTAINGVYTVSVVADGDNQLIESNEDNNKKTRTISVIPPDIFIPEITWLPENPSIGDIVTFTTNITNLGGGTTGGFYLAYYLDDTLLSSEFVSGILPDVNTLKTYDWATQNGRHTFKVVADFNERVVESNENNNETSVIITPRMPDIVPGTITWSPADMLIGSKIIFAINIENRGTLNAGPSRVAYYIDGLITGYNDIDQLYAGAFTTLYLPWVVANGSHTITIVTDSNDQVYELDETNNTKVVNIPLPELIVTDVTWSPPEASIGDSVTFTAIIKNQGNGLTEKTRAICYVDGLLLASQELPQINPAASVTKAFVWVATAGTHNIRILADDGNLVTEVDETNNDIQTTFSTLTPDLVADDIKWSMENPLLSDKVILVITVRNQGTDTAKSSLLAYSVDNATAVIQDIPSLSAGDSFSLTLTPLLKAGTHTVVVSADVATQVIEIDETNNGKILVFSTVAPDLIIKSISWSSRAVAGDNITITVNVENQGKEKSDKSRLDVYINGSLLASTEIDELSIGAMVSKDFSWKAIAGPQEISARVDTTGLLLESNEANNAKSRPISLSEPEKPEKKTVNVSPVSSEDKGFIGNAWWMFLLVALLLGGGSLLLVLRSYKKK